MSLNIQAQILDETTVGMAQGIKMATRKIERPLNFELATKATARPQNAFERHGADRKNERVLDRQPKIGVRQNKQVIAKAHEACRGNPVKLVFEDRVDKNLDEWVSDYQEHHENGRHDQIPCQPSLALQQVNLLGHIPVPSLSES